MIISGVVINRTGKYKYIFKRNVGPNQRVKLSDLYEMYESKCGCDFDEKFIAWLKENKIPDTGWEFDEIVTGFDKPVTVVSQPTKENETVNNQPLHGYDKVKSRDISNLKMKDNPKYIINNIDSIHKLRRALTMAKKKKGKSFLIKLIKARINKLQKEEE